MTFALARRKLNTAWHKYRPKALWQRGRIAFQERYYEWLNDRYSHHYQLVGWEAFLARQRSQTVFVFGSAASLKDVTPAEWHKIDQHNTLGWRSFVFQEYVHADYLILREMAPTVGVEKGLTQEIQRITQQLQQNRHFDEALIIVQAGRKALGGNFLMGHQLAPKNYPYLRYHNGRRDPQAYPATSLEAGITHVNGTLSDAVNFAYLGGWQQIVLIGIDLYNSLYFIDQGTQDHERIHGTPAAETVHSTARSGIVELMGRWRVWLNDRGVQISVYNPRSLMAEVMPVFEWGMLDDGE